MDEAAVDEAAMEKAAEEKAKAENAAAEQVAARAAEGRLQCLQHLGQPEQAQRVRLGKGLEVIQQVVQQVQDEVQEVREVQKSHGPREEEEEGSACRSPMSTRPARRSAAA